MLVGDRATRNGGAGIRTQGALARPVVFKTTPFGRSGTPPRAAIVAGRRPLYGSQDMSPQSTAGRAGTRPAAA